MEDPPSWNLKTLLEKEQKTDEELMTVRVEYRKWSFGKEELGRTEDRAQLQN